MFTRPFSNKPPIVEAFTNLSNDTFLRLIDGKLVDPRVEINIPFDSTLNILPYKNGCVTFARDFFLTFLFLFSVRVHATLIGFSFEAGAAAELWLYNVIYVCTVSMFHFWRLLWSFALRLLYKKNLTHSLPPHDNQHTKTLTHLGLCLEQILLAPPLCCCSGACMVTKLKVSDQKWRSAKSYIFILIVISLNAWAKLKGKLLAIWIVSQNFWNAFQFQSVLFQIFLSTKKLLLLWVCELFLDILLSAIRKLYLMYMCVIWDLDPISWKKFLACICFYHWLYFLLLFGNVVVVWQVSFSIFFLWVKKLWLVVFTKSLGTKWTKLLHLYA